MTASAVPTRRRGRSRRRTLALLVASGCALVGVVLLAVAWFGLGVRALQASTTGDVPCLVAYEDDPDVSVHFELLPPRAVCVRETGDERQEVVVATSPTALVVGGLALGVGGIVGSVVALRPPRARVGAGDFARGGPTGGVGPA
ncbi:hypothetical protein [Cellulomonas sp. S1-8]|uniref:hypothetical protein n=1 Tax=Cellulomonas sp. S1-8 TaxID=2904790 RepID=UPI002244C236|nr:hypothetical protein [Cellulomonas sp. S1-8]UZN04497.1 hypothetical protein OKX07_06175 [Cellulomonas sp. S1-8]